MLMPVVIQNNISIELREHLFILMSRIYSSFIFSNTSSFSRLLSFFGMLVMAASKLIVDLIGKLKRQSMMLI